MRFLALICAFFAAVSQAATLELIPGSAPQTTRLTAYTPDPIGVVLRDDDGNPIPGVAVSIRPVLPSNPARLFLLEDPRTDADGIAYLDPVASGAPGDTFEMATAAGAIAQLPTVTILDGPVASVVVVSGDDQVVDPSAHFPLPWVARALDGSGAPVPYALVDFRTGTSGPGGPYATFDGSFTFAVKADAFGVATSPLPLAGANPGALFGRACSAFDDCAEFSYEIAAEAEAVELVSAPPFNIEVNRRAIEPFVVRVLNASGEGVAGVPVNFETDASCGSFGGSPQVEVISNASGLAASPRFVGTRAGVICPTNATIDGVPEEIDLDMFVFAADGVRIHAPLFVQARAGREFQVTISFTAKDEVHASHPIYGLPVVVGFSGVHNGASATLVSAPTAPYSSDEVTLRLKANSKTGLYLVSLTRGPAREWIVVDQRRR